MSDSIDEVINRSTLIGEGSYSKVYRAEHNGTILACKVIKLSQDSIRELSFMRKIRHPNIILLVDFIINSHSIALFSPLADLTLHDFIYLNNKLSDEVKCKLVYELLSGILFLHNNGLCHCDIKPTNLLVNNGSLIIADLGSIERENESYSLPTFTYAPPELLSKYEISIPESINALTQQRIDNKYVDIWGIGLTIFFIIKGKSMIEYTDDTLWMKEYARYLVNPDRYHKQSDIPEEWSILIQRTLNPIVNEHIKSIEEILSYPIFENRLPITGDYITPPRINNTQCSKYKEGIDDMLNNIIGIGRELDFRLETVFNAIDMMYQLYDVISAIGVQNMTIALLFISTALHERDYRYPPEYWVKVTSGIVSENKLTRDIVYIIQALKGYVERSTLYTYAFSLHSIEESLSIVYDSNTYQLLDFKKYMKNLMLKETVEEKNSRKSKNVKISILD